MSNILISGISGFLGSGIAQYLCEQGHKVFGLIRQNSNLDRCSNFNSKVIWINIDDENWKDRMVLENLDIIIHAAWGGVNSKDRDNPSTQLCNLNYLSELLRIAEKCNIEKFIGFGSQSEYGKIEHEVTEEFEIFPFDEYGISKVLAGEYIKHKFRQIPNTHWYWLRIFSVFGETENPDWFIPFVANKILDNSQLDLTSCHQVYSYLHLDNFVEMVNQFIIKKPKSGIYNICGVEPLQLRKVVEMICNYLNPNFKKINFGAKELRPNQSTFVHGSINKFQIQTEFILDSTFEKDLYKTLEFIRKSHKSTI